MGWYFYFCLFNGNIKVNNKKKNSRYIYDNDIYNYMVYYKYIKNYIIGFFLAIFLTIISFFIVISEVIEDSDITRLVLFILAILQIIIHMIYFLHMNFKSEESWYILSLIFTALVICIMFSGSLWIMYHIHEHNIILK